MLRRVDSASLSFRKKSFSKSRYVHLWAPGGARRRRWSVDRGAVDEPLRLAGVLSPIPNDVNVRTYWYFQDRFYSENDGLNADQVHALLLTRQQREQRRIDRAQAMVSMGLRRQEQAYRRDVIPDDVKQTSTPPW